MAITFTKRASLFVVSLISFFFAVIFLELGMRAIHAIHHWKERPYASLISQTSAIPGLDYEMAPNREMILYGIPVKTNQYGMRDWEPSTQKTDSHCRIAVVGDSYTFGLGVPVEDTYPKVLEKLLRKSSAAPECQFEVLNFGVVGYSSYDEDLMLKYRVVNFDPRVVVLGYVLNDPEIDPVQPLHSYLAKHPWWQPYRLLSYVTQVKADWDRKRLGKGDYFIYLHAQGERKWQSVVDAFSDIREITSRRNIKVLVVIFPELTESFKGKPWAEYPYTKIHQQVSGLAAKNGFRVVDLLGGFSEYPSRDLVFPGIDDHPNVQGHEVTARTIENELLKESSYFFDLKPEHGGNASAPVKPPR